MNWQDGLCNHIVYVLYSWKFIVDGQWGDYEELLLNVLIGDKTLHLKSIISCQWGNVKSSAWEHILGTFYFMLYELFWFSRTHFSD